MNRLQLRARSMPIVAFALVALISACATQPPAASLAAIKLDASRTAMAECMRQTFTTYRHIPLVVLADACNRAVYGRPMVL